jgi:MoaA/NifB/PqqE/SkfB family radical SAM enzyme
VVEVAHPGFKKELGELKKRLKKKGINLIFQRFTGTYQGKEYPLSYTSEELNFFKMTKRSDLETSYFGQMCNAGVNAFMVDYEGKVYPCYGIREEFSTCLGNVYEGWTNSLHVGPCPAQCCKCPLNKYDEPLFKKAKKYSNI